MQAVFPPERIGLSSSRLDRAYGFLERAVQRGDLPGAAIRVARRGQALPARAFGSLYPDVETRPMKADSIFLVASVTKPVTVAAVMLLVEQGVILLSDPVASIIPEFAQNDKADLRIWHLMTHTSGLPDMLPENRELRERHAPLSEFIERICALPLDFEPGTGVQYQSCGTAMLGAVVERISGLSLPEFLRQEFFEPLGMVDTALGDRGLDPDRIAHVNLPAEMVGADWGWNTAYWWNLGAPWGGMFSTVSDMLRFCQMFLDQGRFGDLGIFSPATVQAMTRDQTSDLPALAAHFRQGHGWGLGWRLFPTADWSYFGDLLSPGSYGHGGATGTVVWVDPARELVCVLFTTEPSANSQGLLGRCSNLVAAAVLD